VYGVRHEDFDLENIMKYYIKISVRKTIKISNELLSSTDIKTI
jgi:hypothetical protein